ncbi:hypothetical protein V5G15_00815 [Neisseria gonorrhoeae]|uniref:hypothetical protein n=8 Tax=Neisseria gonorrhoeae TaxID=485 RepID=UPI00210F10B3|nr:hypothetical protein [Neisseria gonorrhoeae]
MEKIINSKVRETNFNQAWRVIRAMQINNISDEQVMIVRMSCYLKKDEIFKNIERYGYQSSDIKKINPPFPLNILPVPKPYYFYLYDTHLNQIYDLAWSCNDFLIFEIFILDRESIKYIDRDKLFKSGETLYLNFKSIKNQCKNYFFAVLVLMPLTLKAVRVKWQIIILFLMPFLYSLFNQIIWISVGWALAARVFCFKFIIG